MQRVGLGYDSHRLVHGRALVLGGIKIDCPLGLAGHSDADVILHAITDAILGACGERDIGELFPDTDPRWAGVDSAQFVRRAIELAADKGLAVGNCDVTVLADQPNLKPYKARMRARIAELLGVNADAVAVKAKTAEGMGAIGRGEGIAALAVVLLVRAGKQASEAGEHA